MLKFRFSVLFILVFCWVVLKNLECSYFNNYPVIHLPEQAHNTIGEIPLVEHIDDGQVHTTNNIVHRSYPVNNSHISTDMVYSGSNVTGYVYYGGRHDNVD